MGIVGTLGERIGSDWLDIPTKRTVHKSSLGRQMTAELPLQGGQFSSHSGTQSLVGGGNYLGKTRKGSTRAEILASAVSRLHYR
jgi:hypothetical protein